MTLKDYVYESDILPSLLYLQVHDTEQIIDIINEINDQDHHKDNSELHVTNEIDGGEDDYRQPIPSIDSDGEESDTNLDVQGTIS